jgi:hypothetical protein
MSASHVAASPPITCPPVVQSPLARISALSLLLLMIIVNFALQPLSEPDFGWHLRTGLDVLHTGLPLPSSDPYSHTMPDWPWVEHAWLTDVLIADLYSAFGALACSLWVALPYLGARTQLITLLGMAVLSWLLKRWRDGSGSVQWWIPPFFLLWANLHGGFVAGLLLLCLVIGTSVIVRLLSDRRLIVAGPYDEPLVSWTDLRKLTLITAISACITLLNPYGWRLHAEIVDSLSNRVMLDTLQEWQPMSMASLAGRRFAVYLGGLGVGMTLWYRRIEPVRWVVGVVFLAFSFRHMRNIPFFLIVSLPLCAELLSEGYDRLHRQWSRDDTKAKTVSVAATLFMAAVLLWEGPEHLHRIVLSGTKPAEYFKTTSYPIEAVEYGYGGFLLWWMPGTKIFIDGRMPAWRTGERAILPDYVTLTREDPDLRILAKYSVDWALVKKGTPLEETLAQQALWERIYNDGKAAIYRLKATTPAF